MSSHSYPKLVHLAIRCITSGPDLSVQISRVYEDIKMGSPENVTIR